ncbi:TetR/AcrR family transcriptional regulator [Streptomyces sp. NPDC051940]|uniref:TetR/AcrR family transcriptional regulator n=1 Tax=Streptomyces sp. NPDC051940 TaxID=3155675 RepID=UPI0034391A89
MPAAAEPDDSAPRRTAAGAAVLRAEVTDAIRLAVLQELAEVGYGRLSIERVARRAGVGKAAVYRRWSSKLPIVLDLVKGLTAQPLPVPDTGSLEGDVRELLAATAAVLRHPMAAQILPDLLAEAARSPELADALREAVHHTQRDLARAILKSAESRGEIRPGVDPDLALDLLAGPLYWRLMLTRTESPRNHLDRLAAVTTAALRAA